MKFAAGGVGFGVAVIDRNPSAKWPGRGGPFLLELSLQGFDITLDNQDFFLTQLSFQMDLECRQEPSG
jgi:hypothetical protein